MCHAKRCRTCGKTTWAGCGLHVTQVRATVPADQWCPGHNHDQPNTDNWLRQIFGRIPKKTR